MDSRLAIEKPFDSLSECVDHIRQHFPDCSRINLDSKDLETGEPMRATAPEFLYRGESQSYPTTVASMQRLKSDSALPQELRRAIERRSIALDKELQQFLKLNQLLSSGRRSAA